MPLGWDKATGTILHSLGSRTESVLPSLVGLVYLDDGLFRGEGRGLRLDEPGSKLGAFETVSATSRFHIPAETS
jgi:hypothetical protein